MITVDSVGSSYGNAQALFDVSFSVEADSVVSILGPNGAGKTTLLDCIAGFKSYEGDILVDGTQARDADPWELAAVLGYCTEENNLFGDLTVEENLRLNGPREERALQENLASTFDLFPRLEERRAQNAVTLSGGESKMLAIGRALMSDPDVIVLDEPSLGLAPAVLSDIDETLERITDRGRTVILSEQNVTFGLNHADKLVVLESGRVRMTDSADAIDQEDDIWETYLGTAATAD